MELLRAKKRHTAMQRSPKKGTRVEMAITPLVLSPLEDAPTAATEALLTLVGITVGAFDGIDGMELGRELGTKLGALND